MLRSTIALLLTAIALTVSACGAGHTIVLEPNTSAAKAQTVRLSYDGSNVKLPEGTVEKMQRYIEDRFFKGETTMFRPGNDLTIKWSFIGYDEGNQFVRWAIGFGAGEAMMVVRADYFDATGKKLASIQAHGTVSMGLFGGSSDDALKNVADQIARYAEANFK
jgi:hypothetical protein